MAERYRSPLGKFIDAKGWSYDETAETISALIGKPVKPNTVKLWSGMKRNPPQTWVAALGIDLDSPTGGAAPAEEIPFDFTQPPPTVGEPPSFEPPTDPAGPRTIPMREQGPAPLGSEYGDVRNRIAQAYGAIGAGMTMVTHNDGYAVTFDTYKDNLAAAWVAAAKDNKNVARIVEFMESGGAVGELVVAHIILTFGLVYVSGRAPALGSIYGKKLEPYHLVAAGRRIEEERLASDAAFDAGSHNGAQGAVGDAATIPVH